MNQIEIEDKIKKCESLSELMAYIDSIDGIHGSYRFYDKITLMSKIPLVYHQYGMPNQITRSCGLRRKVMELSKVSQEVIDYYCQMD